MERERKIKNFTFIENGSADFDEKNICCENQGDHVVNIFWRIVEIRGRQI